MAAQRKKTSRARRSGKIIRVNPVPRDNPKSGPPVYFPVEPGEISVERIVAAVDAVIARRKIK
jgi:hypothetical protein